MKGLTSTRRYGVSSARWALVTLWRRVEDRVTGGVNFLRNRCFLNIFTWYC